MNEFKLVPGVNVCSNYEYHSDKNWLSSTSIKDFIKDREEFYKVYIEKSKQKDSINESVASDGTLTHSLILEPEKFNEEYAVFDGWRKLGKEYDDFKLNNLNKHIITKPQLKKVESWIRSYENLPEAKNLINGGVSEHSIALELEGIKVKVRADYWNENSLNLVDVKTSSLPSDHESFKDAVRMYGYDLSAALYVMVFEKFYNVTINNFYFIVLGKKDIQCQVYRLSNNSLIVGKSKVLTALKEIKLCIETNNWTKPINSSTITTSNYEIKEI